jgi:hypothetical protein
MLRVRDAWSSTYLSLITFCWSDLHGIGNMLRIRDDSFFDMLPATLNMMRMQSFAHILWYWFVKIHSFIHNLIYTSYHVKLKIELGNFITYTCNLELYRWTYMQLMKWLAISSKSVTGLKMTQIKEVSKFFIC